MINTNSGDIQRRLGPSGNRLKGSTLTLALAAVGAACSSGGPAVAVAAKENATMEKTIRFHPGRSYEVTGIWIEADKMEALNAYFKEVFPLAVSKYGVKPLFGLEPISAHAGDFVPQIMFVNEWPSTEDFQRFIRDPAARALFPKRDALVKRLVVTQYQVPEETSVSLRQGDVVEFAGMWVKPGQADELMAYYREAFAIAKRHGIRPMTPLQPVLAYQGDFLPTRAGLNLWGSKTNFDNFETEAKPLFARRNAALDRLEVTHAYVRFGEAR